MPYKIMDSIEQAKVDENEWLDSSIRAKCPECGQDRGVEKCVMEDDRTLFKFRAHQTPSDSGLCGGSHYRVNLTAKPIPLYGPNGWYDSEEYADEREAAQAGGH